MNKNQIDITFNRFQNIISKLSHGQTIFFSQFDVDIIVSELTIIAEDIEKEFPFYSNQINSIKNILFNRVGNGYNAIPFKFGRMFEILTSLMNIAELDVWSLIHHKISDVSKTLYLDGHYAEAALKAFVAINQRMKEIYKIQCPQEKELDGVALMNTMFSDKDPKIEICSRDTETGQNIHMGTRFMLAGAMSALRNPQAHEIIKLSSDDAMRQLMFASMLMFKIDEAVTYSNIQEQ